MSGPVCGACDGEGCHVCAPSGATPTLPAWPWTIRDSCPGDSGTIVDAEGEVVIAVDPDCGMDDETQLLTARVVAAAPSLLAAAEALLNCGDGPGTEEIEALQRAIDKARGRAS